MKTETEVTPEAAEAFFATLHPIFRECVEPGSGRWALDYPVIRDGKVWATNGRIAARCDATPEMIAAEVKADGEFPKVAAVFHRLDSYFEESFPAPKPKKLSLCEKCKGTRVRITGRCDRCYGSGQVECNMGHDHDCDKCEGSGIIEGGDPCGPCEATGVVGWENAATVLKRGVLLNWKFTDILRRHGAHLRLAKARTAESGAYWFIPGTDVDGMAMPVTVEY